MTHDCTIPQELVPADYMHDPSSEVVLSGNQLREGMVVVLEYPFFRSNPDQKHVPYQRPVPVDERDEKARWCRIERLEQVLNDVVTFVAEYDGGRTVTRRYSVTMKWYVKKDSLPSS